MFDFLVYKPLYNILVLLIDTFPSFDLGVIAILFTILIKCILLPLSMRASQTSIAMKKIEPELKLIQEKFKDNKQMLAVEMMQLYKTNKIKPFSLILTLLIQIPILIGMYFIFFKAGLPKITTEYLYSFVSVPNVVPSMMFLGIFPLTEKSIVFAVVTGLSQFLVAKFSATALTPQKIETPPSGEISFKEEFQKSMSFQMTYILPLIIGYFSYTLPLVLSIYWITSNIVQLIQDTFIKRIHNQ